MGCARSHAGSSDSPLLGIAHCTRASLTFAYPPTRNVPLSASEKQKPLLALRAAPLLANTCMLAGSLIITRRCGWNKVCLAGYALAVAPLVAARAIYERRASFALSLAASRTPRDRARAGPGPGRHDHRARERGGALPARLLPQPPAQGALALRRRPSRLGRCCGLARPKSSAAPHDVRITRSNALRAWRAHYYCRRTWASATSPSHWRRTTRSARCVASSAWAVRRGRCARRW